MHSFSQKHSQSIRQQSPETVQEACTDLHVFFEKTFNIPVNHVTSTISKFIVSRDWVWYGHSVWWTFNVFTSSPGKSQQRTGAGFFCHYPYVFYFCSETQYCRLTTYFTLPLIDGDMSTVDDERWCHSTTWCPEVQHSSSGFLWLIDHSLYVIVDIQSYHEIQISFIR